MQLKEDNATSVGGNHDWKVRKKEEGKPWLSWVLQNTVWRRGFIGGGSGEKWRDEGREKMAGRRAGKNGGTKGRGKMAGRRGGKKRRDEGAGKNSGNKITGRRGGNAHYFPN